MKRITAIALFILAGLVSAGNVLAQDHGVRTTVPFDFTVGNKVLPSGTYTIEPATENGNRDPESREEHCRHEHQSRGQQAIENRYIGLQQVWRSVFPA
jgi:hypothetical protein